MRLISGGILRKCVRPSLTSKHKRENSHNIYLYLFFNVIVSRNLMASTLIKSVHSHLLLKIVGKIFLHLFVLFCYNFVEQTCFFMIKLKKYSPKHS